nr:kinase [Aquisediminimonas sediminicola]
MMTDPAHKALDIVLSAIIAALRQHADGPLVVGICGAQGSGKSTLARQLEGALAAQGLRSVTLSLDDLYLPVEARIRLADEVHPLLRTRGVPGTHEVALGLSVLDDVRDGKAVHLPRFDKATDSRAPKAAWPLVAEPVDVVLFEGWCVGAVAEDEAALAVPVNALEAEADPDGRWRQMVNAALKGPYQDLFARIDLLVLLAAPGFDVVAGWRIEQEHELRRQHAGVSGGTIMTDAQVMTFIQYYERLTRHILREMPGRADLVLYLDAQRRVLRCVHRHDDTDMG